MAGTHIGGVAERIRFSSPHPQKMSLEKQSPAAVHKTMGHRYLQDRCQPEHIIVAVPLARFGAREM
jgi:hypothetical protein